MKYSLSSADFLKGLVVAVGTAVLVIIQSTIEAGTLEFNWKMIGIAAGGAAVSYLLKNFFTDTNAEAQKIVDKSNK